MSNDTTPAASTASISLDVPNLQALADAILRAAQGHTTDAVTLAATGLGEVLKAHDARITALEAELFRRKPDAQPGQ